MICTIASPFGPLEVTVDGDTCTAIRMQKRSKPRVSAALKKHPVIVALMEYIAGERSTFDDISMRPQGTQFQHEVWKELRRLPAGYTTTYGEIAEKIGCKSSQAVGQAVGANPIMIMIPCHRVLPKGGSLAKVGGFAWGAACKKKLLQHEQDMKKARA